MADDNQTPPDDSSLSDYQREEIEKTRAQAALQKKTEYELQTEERFQKYFEDYQPNSVKDFISDYAQKKSFWYRFGNFWIEQAEREGLQWINAAEKHLGIILQKKLFDAQCLWRAEKITLPDVFVTFDFVMWEHDIFNCPFIEPVTEEEVDLYIQYLQQNNVDLLRGWWYESWQDYSALKQAYNTDNENRNFPEWYDFHCGRTGTSTYLIMPDTRGEKESFYERLFYEKHKEENDAKRAEFEKKLDKRSRVQSTYDKDFMQWFIATFDDKQTLEYYKAYLYNHRNTDNKERLHNNIRLLLAADEPVPIDAHYDFKEAIEIAVEKYTRKKIIEFLPAAFTQYQLNVSMGIQPPKFESMESYRHTQQFVMNRILDGREINGEPRDFNF